MKTLIFTLSLLFIVSCGKDNKSGSTNERMPVTPDPIRAGQTAEIIQARETANGVMVEGTVKNFAIPVYNITNIFTSKNLIGVIYMDGGLHVRIYNALGRMVMGSNANMTNPRLNVRDGIAGLEFQDRNGRSRYIAVNLNRAIVDITAEDIHGAVDYGVVAVVYRNAGVERAFALKSDGRALFPERTYVRPRFQIDPYTITLEHSRGVERIQH